MTDTSTTGPADHHRMGPSSLRYREICPGYDGMQSTNPAAEMGTRIHAALETDDLSGLHNDWEVLLVTKCQEARVNIMNRLRFVPDKTYREIRLDIDLGEGIHTFGTSDEIMVSGNTGIKIDWKSGRGAVDEAEVNCQAQAYVLGAFQKFPEIHTLHFYFVLPARDEISFATYTREDIPRIQTRLRGIIKRATEILGKFDRKEPIDPAILKPNPNICCYCANPGRCPALTYIAMEILSKYATDFKIPDEVHGSAIDDPETLATLLPWTSVMETWAGGIKKRSKEVVLEEGLTIPGYEIKERAGSKAISSALAAYEAVKDHMTLEEFLGQIGDLPFNSIADVVYNAAPKGKKTKAKNELEDALRDQGALIDKPKTIYLSAVKS